MLCKLAWGNVRRAGRDYLIYLLTLTLGVTVFYAFNTISMQVDLVGIASDAEGVATMLGNILGGLTVFLGAIMGFLMVYANNFIMRRRNKEFGLYQVLGMSRGQVARIMALETLIVSLAALAMGIALGVGLSQLMVFFTASLFKTQVANFRFIFSPEALGLTVECLAVIFAATLVFNLRVVGKSRLTDLMSSGRHNEQVKTRNPWLSGAVCVIGGALIGTAYARLIRDGLPITATGTELASATTQFGITTLMVTVGTVLFFFGLSGLPDGAGRLLARAQRLHAAAALGQGEHRLVLDGRNLDDPLPRHHLRYRRHVDRERDDGRARALEPRGLQPDPLVQRRRV